MGRMILATGRYFAIAFLLALTTLPAAATHLRAGEITMERVSCTSLTFRITITIYTDTGSPIKFGDGVLDFGDGTTFITPQIDHVLREDLGPQVGYVSFTIEHTYAGPGRYVISYLEANRNAGVLNMSNSVDTRFYVETEIRIDPFLGCSNTPKLLIPPIDKGCTGAAFFHNAGAYDPDGDSLSYELTIPKREKDLNVIGYLDPNNQKFYDAIGLNYGTANEAGNGSPEFSIDPKTGTLVWDAPGAPGEYNVAFKIIEWRKVSGVWIQQGYVIRDMQIIIEDCLNQRPELQVPPDICVVAGETITIDIFGTDPDFDSVKIEAFSQVFSINPSPATVTPFPAIYQDTAPGVNARLTFTWNTECEHIKDQPYQVVFKISDNSNSGPTLVQFATWNVRVVGPAPIWEPPQVDLGTRSAILNWEDYACKIKANNMQLWRRVNQYAFTPPECVTGMPDFLGYTKIADLPINTTTFTDNNNGAGLAVGAQYCYRLVAAFPQPGGGESYVSQEVCLPPILADAPVITNVSVDVTSTLAPNGTSLNDGKVTVRWRPPFEADPVQFPPPYTYEVHRAEGFSGDLRLTSIFPGRISDTTYVDTQLNTRDVVYNYRVTAFASNGTRVDVSPTASTVRLETGSQFLRIALTWNADVPWANQTQDYPYHLIYRGKPGETESQLVLIDSLDVNQYHYNYIDSGQYQNTPLKETEQYCYRVMTRGAYGNPRIIEPLENFSQIICGQPNDDKPPCQPVLAVEGRSCDEYLQTSSCGVNVYSNLITWRRPSDQACRDDVRSYKVYWSRKSTDEVFTEVAMVTDTFFVHSNLPSFAGCYKVSAIDRAGNESELSETYCFDNCPYYELPNVFTPNGDECNDLFSAYSDRIADEIGEGELGPCGQNITDLRKRCARFVLSVDFTVYNRWGNEVYRYRSGGERSIYIDWDGKDNAGKDLTGGVYYYSAEVTFDVVDPSKEKQVFKGWVHLIR